MPLLALRTPFPVPAAAPVLPRTGRAAAGTRHGTARSLLPSQPQCHVLPAEPSVTESVGAAVPRWGHGQSPGPWCPLSCGPCAGPHVPGSPEGAAGSCLPSFAWLNLNRAGLLHRFLPTGDKDGQAGALPAARLLASSTGPRPLRNILPLPRSPCPPQRVLADTRATGRHHVSWPAVLDGAGSR